MKTNIFVVCLILFGSLLHAQNERTETLVQSEEKGMETDANVKNYGMEIIEQGNHVAGFWTGDVHTVYKSSFITLPIAVNYHLANRWKIHLGIFASYRMDGNFSGYVTEGYLREGSPIGEKVSFSNGQTASYDFSNHLRHWHLGRTDRRLLASLQTL